MLKGRDLVLFSFVWGKIKLTIFGRNSNPANPRRLKYFTSMLGIFFIERMEKRERICISSAKSQTGSDL